MQQAVAMKNAKKVILEVAEEFEKISGRKYGLFEEYKLDDAEVAIVIMNSAAGTSKDAIDILRDKGIKAGLLKLRVFRPFPADEIREALKHVKALAVMDRAESFSSQGGPVYPEVMAAPRRRRSLQTPEKSSERQCLQTTVRVGMGEDR